MGQTYSCEEHVIILHSSRLPDDLLAQKQMQQNWITTLMMKPLLPLLEDVGVCGFPPHAVRHAVLQRRHGLLVKGGLMA
ncbi:hypothetical protein Cfor_06330 [Coptotermes formosanus]|uniref:Uncharacterized protein n=1 Tax=Coptotermes formosanus TaxID=36987 RepID=A0A6L2PJR8_COPFO|nr:hypothetical protein Cfor_06330 [Coptotermes formosanus]